MRFVAVLAAVLVGLAVAGAALAYERDFVFTPGAKGALGRATTVHVYNWTTDLLGDADVKGLVLDLDSEASFGSRNRLGLAVTHGISKDNNLMLSYNSFDHSGRIRQQVTFDNRTYRVGAAMKVQNSWFDLAWSHNFTRWDTPTDRGRNRLGGYFDGLIGIKVNDSSLDVAGYDPVTAAYNSGSWNEKFPIPYLGIGGGNQISKNFWVTGHFKFLAANVGGGSVKSYDFDLNAALQLNPGSTDSEWFAVLGFRTFHINGESGGDDLTVGYRGPTFGLTGRF